VVRAGDRALTLSETELLELRRARQLLEQGSVAVRLAELIGHPLEKGLTLLPGHARERIQELTEAALQKALRTALATLEFGARKSASERLHGAATIATGALGGLFGLGGLAVELPVTTVLMLRSIADIARSEGHDLAAPETRLACLEVFALGGPSGGDDAGDTAYYAVRAGLAKALADAAQHVVNRGMAREGAPALLRVVAAIAARFGIVVQEKVALSALPVVGALSGSLINAAFTRHFQARARGHFVVRRLEAIHTPDAVRRAYESLGPLG
jgi:hypothetical protein